MPIISKNQLSIVKQATANNTLFIHLIYLLYLLLLISFISRINDINMYITLTNINPIKSIIKTSLYILTLSIFCNTDVVNVMPPTNDNTIDAKIPKIVIYSLSIFLIM